MSSHHTVTTCTDLRASNVFSSSIAPRGDLCVCGSAGLQCGRGQENDQLERHADDEGQGKPGPREPAWGVLEATENDGGEEPDGGEQG